MLRILWFVGLLNAAIWLGGCVFFSFAAAPAIFQPEMKRLLQDYHTGLVAQLMQQRYFSFQLVCGVVALLHTLAAALLTPRRRAWLTGGLLGILCAITLAGIFWFQPHLKALYDVKYRAPELAQREAAAVAFRGWHGLSQGLNLIMLGGLVVYLWRTAAGVPDQRSLTGQASAAEGRPKTLVKT
jgi:hypothetical protein